MIRKEFKNSNYLQYSEIKKYSNQDVFKSISFEIPEIPDDFEEKRKKDENDSYIYELI